MNSELDKQLKDKEKLLHSYLKGTEKTAFVFNKSKFRYENITYDSYLSNYIKIIQDLEGSDNKYSAEEIRKLLKITVIETHIEIADNKDIDYPSPVKLNPKEKELYNKNITKGVKTLWEGKKAVDKSKELYSSGCHNGNCDAFRHGYWNALMSINIDIKWAREWATAHELGASNQPKLEEKMDLYNNNKGRQISLTCTSDYAAIDKVLDAVKKGKLRRIYQNKKLIPTSGANLR